MALTLTSKSLNRYEQYHDLLKNNRFYSDDSWDNMAKMGRLDEYIDVLTKTNERIKDCLIKRIPDIPPQTGMMYLPKLNLNKLLRDGDLF